VTRVRHLVARFFGSLRARPLGDADRALVRTTLDQEEFGCWERLGRADRAESVATARAAIAQLGPEPESRWIAAALLHDVGKAETALGPYRRAAATVVATMAGSRRARGWQGGIGRYVNHDVLGAAGLEAAGARREAVEWAAVHHRPELWASTSIPPEICRILAAADGEPLQE